MVVLALIIMMSPNFLFAQEISATQKDTVINIKVTDIPLPEGYLNKSLKSGLSTNIVSRVTIEKKDRQIGISNKIYKMYFDLWDEVYHLTYSIGGKIKNQKFRSQKTLLKKIRNANYEIISNETSKGLKLIKVTFKIIIDPISKEKIKKIRKWLAQNTVNAPAQSSIARTAGSPGGGTNQQNSSSQTSSVPPGGITTGGVFRGVMESLFESEFEIDSSAGGWAHKSEKAVKLRGSDAK